jgi:AcrR family transcriptional regulator
LPRRSRAESEATAAEVSATARALFAERGYAAVGLEEVASSAGVTRGAVYHHYGSKQALFRVVLATVQAEIGEAVAVAADARPDPWEAFTSGCRAFLTAALDERRRRIVLVDAPAVLGWDAWRALDEEHAARHLRDAVADLLARGLLRTPSVGATTALLSGAMNEAALWAATEADGPGQAEAALEALLAGLRVSQTRS